MLGRRVFSTIDFRRGVPGIRLTSVMNMAKYEGQTYTFQYVSKGPKEKPRRNKDFQPLLLLAVNKGKKVWKAANGKSYIYGFNLNYLPEAQRLSVIKSLIELFNNEPGKLFSYSDINAALGLPASTENTIFRKYDVRGSKLRSLKQVNLDTYSAILEEQLDAKEKVSLNANRRR